MLGELVSAADNLWAGLTQGSPGVMDRANGVSLDAKGMNVNPNAIPAYRPTAPVMAAQPNRDQKMGMRRG